MAERAWEDLSPGYRSRLLGATRSGKLTGTPVAPEDAERVARQYRASGGSLNSALGRKPRRATGAAPKVATDRVSRGTGTDADDRALGRWRRSRSAPAWIPVDPAAIGNDTAAILSQIVQAPSEWNKVDFAEQSDGTFLMTVSSRDRTKQSVTLQDRNQVSEVATLLNETSRRGMAANTQEQKRLDSQWRRGKRRRSMKVNISYGRAAAAGGGGTGTPGEARVPKTAEELFGQSVGPAFESGAGAAEQRPSASRSANQKKTAAKPSKGRTNNKKATPPKRSTSRRRSPNRPLGILDDVIATIDEALNLGEVDVDTAVNAIQAQIEALQKQIDRLQGQ